MSRRRILARTAAMLLAGSLAAQAAAWADAPGGIVTHHGKVIETAKAGLPTQGFLEIDNQSASADTLTGIACPIADRSRIVGAGGAPIAQLPVAAGQLLVLTAAGPHILLEATHFGIDRGGAIPCSLTFQNAGEILVYLYAIPAPSSAP